MGKYQPAQLEKRWQEAWKKAGLYHAEVAGKKPKYYVLDMFPYPSGDGLHVGHFKGYMATDVISRFLRAKGYNVLHPMGWDAFGLPAENYAIKTGIQPKITTAKNIGHIKAQMQMVGLSYDWDREINTTDPDYYRWTQWIFLQLFKKGLAYEAEAPINWCPKDKTGLANEEVVNGTCDRCGTKVVRKRIRQWILAITKYADRLLSDLEGLDWPEPIVEMQRNWIGRSEGIEIKFKVESRESRVEEDITVFTKFPETIFGVTYMVVAPEYETLGKLTTTKYAKEVDKYIKVSQNKSDLERTALEKEKTGVFTGSYCINPVNGQKVPIWVSDYVIGGYGTGAVMGVPGSDVRDFQFARKHNLPIVRVIASKKGDTSEIKGPEDVLEHGFIVNSGQFDGLSAPASAKEKFMDFIEKNGWGTRKVNYKLRDWIFSRQRYWGEPIPIVHCPSCGTVALSEEDLPLLLPEVEKYQPTGTGESPLAAVSDWVNTKCPNCKGPAVRETNTMPQWAGSCWYYLRFIDPKNSKKLVSPELEKYWMGEKGVDWYVGGAEHAVLHLLYARFWHKFLFDIGVVSTKEPFYKLRNVGLIMGPDGQKMSKSRGNVISPEEMVGSYGADTMRLFEMFIGPFGDSADWKPTAVAGVYRFLQRVFLFSNQIIDSGRKESDKEMLTAVSRLIKNVEKDILEMKFNTSVAFMMEFVNTMSRNLKGTGSDVLKKFLLVLAPFVPHMAEELWQTLDASGPVSSVARGPVTTFPSTSARSTKLDTNSDSESNELRASGSLSSRATPRDGTATHFRSIHQEPWPEYDEKYIKAESVTIVVQVNGKVRDQLLVEAGISQKDAERLALNSQKVIKFLGTQKPRKVIFVPGKLVNLVV